jgi:hypothetical protein
MKLTFTPEEIMRHSACYTRDQVLALSFISQPEILLIDILDSEVSIKHKSWFLFNKCEMTLEHKRQLCLKMLRIVLPIYEDRFPGDNRVRVCLDAVEKFIKGEISKELLRQLGNASYSDFLGHASTYVGYAAAEASRRAYALSSSSSVYAAIASNEATYSQKLLYAMIEFVKSNS